MQPSSRKHGPQRKLIERFFADTALIAHHVFDTVAAEIGIPCTRSKHTIEQVRLLNQLAQIIVPSEVSGEGAAKVAFVLPQGLRHNILCSLSAREAAAQLEARLHTVEYSLARQRVDHRGGIPDQGGAHMWVGERRHLRGEW